MAQPPVIHVRGLDELRRELRKLADNGGLVDELKDANADVARDVIGWATDRARGVGRMEARAAASMTAGRTQKAATIRLGGARVPYAEGAEFGAGQDRPRQTARGVVRGWNQFAPWTGSGGTAGRWLYPAIRSHTDEIVDTYGDAIDRLMRRAFPD